MQAEWFAEVLKEVDTSTLVRKLDLEIGLSDQTITITNWLAGILLAQGALIVALIPYFK
jgi:hypothetical protein